MKTIYKYHLRYVEIQDLELPAGADVLSIQEQLGDLCVWVIFDKDKYNGLTEKRRIYKIGTGDPIPEGMLDATLYVGTVQSGRMVWHFFVSRNRG